MRHGYALSLLLPNHYLFISNVLTHIYTFASRVDIAFIKVHWDIRLGLSNTAWVHTKTLFFFLTWHVLWVGYITRPCDIIFNLLPTNPGLITGLKTRWKEEKLLLTSNFSFFHRVFYLFGDFSAIFIKMEIIACKLLSVWKSLTFDQCDRVKLSHFFQFIGWFLLFCIIDCTWFVTFFCVWHVYNRTNK